MNASNANDILVHKVSEAHRRRCITSPRALRSAVIGKPEKMSKDQAVSESARISGPVAAPWIDNILFFFLTAATFSLAIPFAGVPDWAQMMYAMAIAVLFLAWLFTRSRVPDPVPAPFARLWLAFALMFLVWIWAVVQVLDLSFLAHPNWQFAANALGQPLGGSISLDRAASVKELIFLISLGFLFWLTMQLGREPRRARLALLFFLAAVSLNAVYGIALSVFDIQWILWEQKRDYVSSLTGTFVNRNSFATYLGLALVVAIALIMDRAISTRRPRLSIRQRLAELLNALFGRSALLIVAGFVLALALILTQSRAGNVAFVVGFLALIAAFAATGKLRMVFAAAVGALVLIPGVIVLILSGGGLLGRMDVSTEELSDARLPLFARVWQMVQDSWATGVGLGNFRQGFYPYIDDSIMLARSWFSAHSTYLELMSELGVIFAGALFVCVALLAADCWFGLRRRRRNNVFCVIGVAATGIVAFHSLVDFSLDIPAVAAAYTFLLALGVSHAASTRGS